MSESLNAEAVLASIMELRVSIAEQGKEIDKLCANFAEQGKRMDEQGRRMDEQGKRMDEQGNRIDKLSEEMKRSNQELREEMRHSNQELREEMKRSNQELREEMKHSNQELREEMKRSNQELRETLERNNLDLLKKIDVNNSKLDENTRTVGMLTNKLGSIIEKIMVPGIVDKFNEKGFKFDSVSTNVEFLNEKKNGNLTEIDALLENGKFVIAVESKTELTVKDVNTHIKRLQALRKVPRFKGKKIYGAFSTAIAKDRSINYALDQGFYVLQQPDVMALRIIDFPKGRCAKAW